MAAPSKPALLAFLPFGFTFIPWHSARHRKWLTPPCRGDHFPFHGKLGSRADHPVPYKSSCWMMPTITSQRHQGERDHAGHVIQSLDFIISVTTEWLWGTIPAVYSMSTMASTGLRNSIL